MKKSRKNLNRREFIKKATLAAGTTALFQSPVARFGSYMARAAAPLQIRIGVMSPSACSLPVVQAFKAGYYRKNGIDASIVYMRDTAAIATGLMTSEIHLGQLPAPLFFMMNAGVGRYNDSRTALVTAQIASHKNEGGPAANNRESKTPPRSTRRPCCVLAVQEKLYRSDPDLTEAVYRASVKSALMLNQATYRRQQIEQMHRDNDPSVRFFPINRTSCFRNDQTTFEPIVDAIDGEAFIEEMQSLKRLPGFIDAAQLAADTYLSELSADLVNAVVRNV